MKGDSVPGTRVLGGGGLGRSLAARVLVPAKHAFEYVLLCVGFGSLGLGCLAVSVLAYPLYLVLHGDTGARFGRAIATYGFRVYVFWLHVCGIGRFDIKALDKLRDAGPLIIVANHPGLLDAPMILSRLPNVVCVLKASLVRTPFWGAGSRLARYIPNDWFLGSVSLAVEELRRGSQLLLFPEGTRTAGASLNEFRSGAAYVSYRSRVPIQTVLIEQDSRFLGKNQGLMWRPDMPVRFRIRLGRRFDPPADPRTFTQTLREYFVAELPPR
jgi:1-acyl-sn-glycerol-3-phosphate acyltransferase